MYDCASRDIDLSGRCRIFGFADEPEQDERRIEREDRACMILVAAKACSRPQWQRRTPQRPVRFERIGDSPARARENDFVPLAIGESDRPCRCVELRFNGNQR